VLCTVLKHLSFVDIPQAGSDDPKQKDRPRAARMVKKLRLLKGGSVPTFVGLGPVLHNKLAVDA
jgi:hypothetical protein